MCFYSSSACLGMRPTKEEAPAPAMGVTSGGWPSFPLGGGGGGARAAGEERAILVPRSLWQLLQLWRHLRMDSRDCDAAAAEPGPPACSCVASWWAMVLRNLR